MLDIQLFGLQPRWHHVTNLLFHIANTLLLFFVLHRMTKARWESAFVAALFALHPLHVESVAWVAERKDVLSAFFWILTMGAYCWYVEHPKLQRYLIVVVFFVFGLMAKPMLVTLPFVLLLLDYWPLQRLQQIKADQNTAVHKPMSGDRQKGNSKKRHTVGKELKEVKAEKLAGPKSQSVLIRPLLWEKTPFFALTVLSSIVTYVVQQKGGAVLSFEEIPLSVRIANAFVSYITYIGMMIWPHDLAVLYPHPGLLPRWQVIGAAFLLIVVTITAIVKARRVPYVAVGWLWYAGSLVPVIGIVQVGIQARADRYTYIPLIGLFIIAAWGISELSKNWRYRKETLIASSTAVLACLSIVTWTQVGYWRNSITLFEHALNVTDNNPMAYFGRGFAYGNLGNYRQAIGDFDKTLEIKPNYAWAYFNRGIAYGNLGNFRQAIGDFDKALEIKPNSAEAYYNRGVAYGNLDNYRQAVEDYGKAIEINPNYAEAYYNRADAFWRLGNTAQAVEEDLKTAARLGYKNAQDLLKRNRGIE
jgi:Flp pilus assembly protein TadD